MKKLLLTLSVVAIGVSAFGQGQVIFGSAAGYVWNINATRAAAGTVDTAFLFSTSSSATPLLLQAGIYNLGTPTNNGAVKLSDTQATTAWSDILTDPNFQLATNTSGSTTVIGTTTATGGVSYNGGGSFLAANTPAAGGNIYVYVISWDATYTTPWAAQSANASVGWSKLITYNVAAGPVPGPSGTATSFTSQTTGWQFGTLGVVATPEPSTMALAALGGASLLLFRRRK